ncbi:MAG TPA: phosphate acyltransferase PlsX [Chthoniobacterales bacterium]
MKIALDAMGGDFAPKNIVAGGVQALAEYSQIEKLFLVGDKAAIERELKANRFALDDPRLEIVHTTEVVYMTDSALDAVRKKKDSSLSRAMDLVKNGKADAFVSAGHTGAVVTAAQIKLRTLPGVDRPGIATVMPTETNLFLLIDAGANPEPRPIHLVQYAIMGSVYSRHVLGYKNPEVGLMSIGGEDTKGTDLTKEVFKELKQTSLNFRGNVEGHDLFSDPVEVVVCDGYVGNVVLKTCESIAVAIMTWLKHELKANPIRLAGAMLAQGAFKSLKKKIDPDEYGGSPLLGVNGTVIIAHGASSARAIKNALRVAAESVAHGVNPHILEEVRRHQKTATIAH